MPDICYKRRKIVYEDSWQGFGSEDAVNVNSVTKGVMAILTGIAVDNGVCLRSTSKSVMPFVHRILTGKYSRIKGLIILWITK